VKFSWHHRRFTMTPQETLWSRIEEDAALDLNEDIAKQLSELTASPSTGLSYHGRMISLESAMSTDTFMPSGQRVGSYSSSGSPTTKELTTQVDPEILRGVSLDVALSGWAKFLRTPDSGMFNVDPKHYELSRMTKKFHAFLSHDWASSRWMKLIAVLILYNAPAASIATAVVSIVVGLLCAFQVMPSEHWVSYVVLPHATFWFVLLFYQRLRSAIGSPVMVFLDKLCIAQHDEALKEKGVLGLAAFLNSSKELTILWSPRYFSRLWCSYEIATFMKDEAKQGSIKLMPLKLGVLLALMTLFWLIGIAIFYVSLDLSGYIRWHTTTACLEACVALLFLPFLNYFGMELVSGLEELPKQMRNFRIQDSECFCCSNNHRHPNTGEEIPCDRLLVHQTLQQWFGRSSDVGEEYCRRFNRLVRNRLATKILRSVGGDALPLSYAFYITCCCNVPWLPMVIARWCSGPLTPESIVWGIRLFLEWAHVSLVVLCVTRIIMMAWKLGSSVERRKCLALAMAFPLFLVGFASWAPFVVVYELTEDDSLLPVIPVLLLLLLVIYLFWPQRVPEEEGACKETRGDDAAKISGSRSTSMSAFDASFPVMPEFAGHLPGRNNEDAMDAEGNNDILSV